MVERINVEELMFKGLNPIGGESIAFKPYDYDETFPSIHIPSGMGNADDYLSFLVYDAAGRKYGECLSEKVSARIQEELSVLKRKSWSGYILFVWDIITMGRNSSEHLLFGPGNGCECCSIVNYLLGITAIDPIEYNLPFERYANENMKHIPKINIHVDSGKHEKFVRMIIERYGNRVARLVLPKKTRKDNTEIPERIDNSVLILSDMSTDFYMSVEERMNDKTNAVERCVVGSHWDLTGKGVSAQMIVPEEELNQLNSLLCCCLTDIKNTDRQKYLDSIPYDDGETYAAIWNGETKGISYLSNSRFRNVARICRPRSISELAILIALSLPMRDNLMEEYIRRQEETKDIDYIIPEFAPILCETHGLLLYQEQLLLLSQLVSGMDGANLESMRKALTKRRRDISMNTYEPLFINGGRGNGYHESFLKNMFQSFWKYGGHTFSKAHYICLATIAYQIIYVSKRISKSVIVSL